MQKIITLCGSTRFENLFRLVAKEESFKGNIILSPDVYAHAEQLLLSREQITLLKRLHRKKIDMCNEILVINPGGYIGESTCDEIKYARHVGKIVRFYEKN